MTFTDGVTIEGMDELERKLNSLGGNFIDSFLKSGLKAMRLNVESQAKQNCPVDTGNLRSSINSQADGETVKTGTTVEYADDVEFGTSRQNAQPFLRPAFDENVNQVISDIQSDLETEIKNRTK